MGTINSVVNTRINPVVNTPKAVVLTRSNELKIMRDAFKSKIRNALPKRIVQAPTLNMFKKEPRRPI